ncbi:MAG: hypothetical protein KGD73_07720 [Candidatus Lokiarchaeota archaeon]|nr:hypothetical protein [Candidatus Lokiarchaeota archaeon]
MSVQDEKKKGYILNDPQRAIFVKKILPSLLMGSLLWLLGELLSSWYFWDIQVNPFYIGIYIAIMVIEVLLYFGFFYASKREKSLLVFLCYGIFSYGAGFISLPLVIFTEFLSQVHMFVSLSVGATTIVFLMGLLLNKNYFAKGNVWPHIFIFLLGILIIEIIFIFVFNIHNFLLTIPISVAYILVVSLVIMFYGAKVMKKDDSPWLYKFAKIQGMLILSLVIAVIGIIVILIIIALAIICGESGADLGNLSLSGRSSTKKKKDKIS